jgi:hypothetical protein
VIERAGKGMSVPTPKAYGRCIGMAVRRNRSYPSNGGFFDYYPNTEYGSGSPPSPASKFSHAISTIFVRVCTVALPR